VRTDADDRTSEVRVDELWACDKESPGKRVRHCEIIAGRCGARQTAAVVGCLAMAYLRKSPFDAVPEAYDRARPEYPAAMYDALFAQLPAAPQIVEVGPGTGQATVDLLVRGATVMAVELGPNIAAFLRKKFEGDERLTVVNSPFETAPLLSGSFDCLAAATSFHWLDRDGLFERIHGLLRRGGVLAVIETNQIASDVDRGFFARTDSIYQRHGRNDDLGPTPGEDMVPRVMDEIKGSGLFEDVRLFRHRWDQTYTTSDYRDLVTSYSNTQTMAPGPREGLLNDLCDFIDAEFDGYVVRPLLVTMVTARAVG
jgi:SAM-dependent methyltransferase